MNDALIRLLLIIIAIITVISGTAQLFFGEAILNIIAFNSAPDAAHLFATVGMFMMVTGALFFHSLVTRTGERVVSVWIAVQKLAAAILVTMAWKNGIFTPLSLGVAGFDLISGILAFLFWKRLP